MDADELSGCDEDILDTLREGRSTFNYLVKNNRNSKTTVHRRLQVLVEGGHVNKVARNLYKLEDDPRENGA